ncbi:MAG: MFS transporter [Chloroflexales bacterium]|nr:MFS transporter [Chloroflexales bacterium]
MSLPLLICLTMLTIAAIYVPQPLLPSIAQELAIANSQAALLTTAVFLPLSVLPLVYGWIIESLNTKRILRVSLAVLMLTSLGMFGANSFPVLFILRMLQGVVLPAVLTSLTTHISTTAQPHRVQRLMSWYIAATIVGGLLGRVLSGAIATWLGWR